MVCAVNHVTDADLYIPGGGLVGFGDAVIFDVQVYLLLCLEYLMVYWEIYMRDIYVLSFDLLSCNCFIASMTTWSWSETLLFWLKLCTSVERDNLKNVSYSQWTSARQSSLNALRNLSNCGASDPFKLWQKKSIEVLISHILWCVGLWAKFQRGWQDLISVRSRPPSAPFQESHSQAGLASKIPDWLDEQYQ